MDVEMIARCRFGLLTSGQLASLRISHEMILQEN
jgi:hypothetical protein